MEEVKEVKKLMSIIEAARYFGIGRDALYALSRTEPDIPILIINDKKKVNVPLFAEWLDKATAEGRRLQGGITMKANTVEQYHILQWLEQNFYIDALKITLVDKAAVRIEDRNGETAIVTYKSKDNIVLE